MAFATISHAYAFARKAEVKRSAIELHDHYDYVIIGGGTSGLTIANRLTEDVSKTVLVVELGDFADEPCISMPKNFLNTLATNCSNHAFNVTSRPITDLNGLVVQKYTVGMAVGGSSAVNGMVFHRASKADYNAWEQLGNPGWGWDGLYRYFKKSTSFGPPSKESAKKYSYTWNAGAYGHGPIWATYPPFQWAATKILWDAWSDLNITGPVEHATGNMLGRYWVPASQHPINQTRSYARYGYYDPIKTRTNYHLLIGYKVEKLKLSSDYKTEGIIISERFHPDQRVTVKVIKEAILAAGAVHTPHILQLSGIGPKDILEAADIEVRVDLPGVGQNMQDHPQARVACNFTKDLWPNPDTLASNATYRDESQAEYEDHKTGPLTLSLGTSFTFLPLQTVYGNHQQFVSKLKAQSPATYLSPNISTSIIAGFAAQKKVLARLFAAQDSAAYETPISGVCSRSLVILKPLSRGSININITNPTGDPVLDLRTFSNPLDIEQAVSFIRYTRRYMNTPTLADLGPVETAPGADVVDEVELIKHVRATSAPTSFHACGTAAMMPRHLGGVVGSDLRVYGVRGLSVVDASIMPLIPATHLSATVYAVAEKVCDILSRLSSHLSRFRRHSRLMGHARLQILLSREYYENQAVFG
ncbi:GMC oxidoreductase [Zopfia rhizophila CBS 207.26]|uniref:GMC oxidoreductase n=1 Tax=Zopfia rhizophila CBS 207.26 TaxID=1314779 RepID=A0A6A6EWE1_9PEZI|nr:GMC oxidoreductase [Zopfia rhizophila CBS 207.26]